MSHLPDGVHFLPGFDGRAGDGTSVNPQRIYAPFERSHWGTRAPSPGFHDSYRVALGQSRISECSSPRAIFNNQCNDSDGANFCECQLNRGKIEKCMFYGRRVEPLAFDLEAAPVMSQDCCPLFALTPREIREMIYEYAFTDCTSNPPDWDNPYRDNPYRREEGDNRVNLPETDIAIGFLQTCRAVYLEAYHLPILLNRFTVYKFGNLPSYDICRPRFIELAPWQFALIQGLDISLQQIALEGDKLSKYLKIWRAKERHKGAVIAPRFYQESRSTYRNQMTQSFNFGILPRSGPLEDGMKMHLSYKSSLYPHNIYPGLSTARVMVARPLTHLTLRLSRTDWWTWGDMPTEDVMRHLALDPAIGNGGSDQNARSTAPKMVQFANDRRAGFWPGYSSQQDNAPQQYTSTWGAEITKLPDLKTLELVLETFEDKGGQLDTVIECAKTWEFPLEDSKDKLAWTGKVEIANYVGQEDARNAQSYDFLVERTGESRQSTTTPPRFEVRIIRYKRAKVQ
ncbi:hypothetical protein BDV96DRAFT_600230 [Lophiotrema nucula]|uniref:Uncharacterized protein n=1 Tax=Lophiotrema nucula TaxID=690887 RepID=A0A6A5Z8P8_9PLEO|nr:hypothetical protein BDV96DRAFT_600230 [Lophiotrema nucula]